MPQQLRFQLLNKSRNSEGPNDYTTIGEGDEQFTYDATNGTFFASDNGTRLQFFTYVEDSKGGGTISNPIKVADIINENTYTNLITIHRNQHIDINLVFK